MGDFIPLLLIGIVTFINLAVIKYKLERKRYEDGLLDGSILFGLAAVFQGSFPGLVVATISSLCMSIYFLYSPPAFMSDLKKLLNQFKPRKQF